MILLPQRDSRVEPLKYTGTLFNVYSVAVKNEI